METITHHPETDYPVRLTPQGRETFLAAWTALYRQGQRCTNSISQEERSGLPFRGSGVKERYETMYNLMSGSLQARGRSWRAGHPGKGQTLYTDSRVDYYDTSTGLLYRAEVTAKDGTNMLTLSRHRPTPERQQTTGKGWLTDRVEIPVQGTGAPVIIVLLQSGEGEDRIHRFHSMDELRAACRPHRIEIGEGVRIGRYTVLGDGCRLGAGCRLGEESVVGEGAILGRETVVGERGLIGRHSTVGRYTVLGRDVFLGESTVLGDGVSLGAECEMGNGASLGGGSSVEDGTVLFPRCLVESDCHIGRSVLVGPDTHIGQDCDIADGCRLGLRCRVLDHHNLPPGTRLTTDSVWERIAERQETGCRFRR